MRALRVVGLTEDGDVVLEDPVRLERFRVPADERLRAAARGDLSRLGQIAIELESQLRPREIQARIRAGASVEQVAAAAGVPEQKIERFAYPVLLERFRTAENAQRAHPVRADGPENRTLAEVVAHTFGLRGQAYEGARWDSWKGEDGRWVVALGWRAGRSDEPGALDVPARGARGHRDRARRARERPGRGAAGTAAAHGRRRGRHEPAGGGAAAQSVPGGAVARGGVRQLPRADAARPGAGTAGRGPRWPLRRAVAARAPGAAAGRAPGHAHGETCGEARGDGRWTHGRSRRGSWSSGRGRTGRPRPASERTGTGRRPGGRRRSGAGRRTGGSRWCRSRPCRDHAHRAGTPRARSPRARSRRAGLRRPRTVGRGRIPEDARPSTAPAPVDVPPTIPASPRRTPVGRGRRAGHGSSGHRRTGHGSTGHGAPDTAPDTTAPDATAPGATGTPGSAEAPTAARHSEPRHRRPEPCRCRRPPRRAPPAETPAPAADTSGRTPAARHPRQPSHPQGQARDAVVGRGAAGGPRAALRAAISVREERLQM